MSSDEPKGEKMYGGLIRPRKNVKREDNPQARVKITEHWDGRQDVAVNPNAIQVKVRQDHGRED